MSFVSSQPPMPTYRGNRGNLLQHWVLAECVTLLARTQQTPLCFIDAHAMSPYAKPYEKRDQDQTAPDFDRVRQTLPGQKSAYELAWKDLTTPEIDYPSSALFVRHLWPGTLHLMLCECNPMTADEVGKWFNTLDPKTSAELHRGDWRDRFPAGLPRGYSAYLVSFDPNMFDRHRPPVAPDRSKMWPADIIRACAALIDLQERPTIVQLSTYSANNGNSQDDVIEIIVPIFCAAGFTLGAPVRADGNMMSLVFSKALPDSSVLAQLPERFKRWLERARGLESG